MSLKSFFSPRLDMQPNMEIVSVCLRDSPYLALQDALRALIALTLAQRSSGKFILQLDDTDPEPLFNDTLDHILNTLSWLDLSPDEFGELGQYGPYSWSQRRHLALKDREIDIYQEVVTCLIDQGWAYLCFCQFESDQAPPQFFKCSPGDKQQCRDLSPDEVENRLRKRETCLVRFRVPYHHMLQYHDPIYGNRHYETESMEDFVLLTPDGMPMPYLAHVVDNHFMQITTQVRRRSDLSIVPQEMLLTRALGWDLPTFIHVPPIQSARSQALFEELHLDQFQQQGYLPETMLNFLTQLIWTHPKDKPVYPHADFQRDFEIGHIPRDALTIDYKLLNYIQGSYTMNKL